MTIRNDRLVPVVGPTTGPVSGRLRWHRRLLGLRRRRRWAVFAQRSMLLSAGGSLILCAIAAVPTPLPGLGLVLFTGGLYFLARGSPRARRSIGRGLRRSPAVSRQLHGWKHRFPPALRRFIDRNG